MKLRFFSTNDLDKLDQLQPLPADFRRAMKVVAQVLPFRTNNYVVDELIDWDNIPEDPIFRLTFPQPGMLSDEHFERMSRAMATGAGKGEIRNIANQIRMELNPHPAGQKSFNVPTIDDESISGVQHKYSETCLVFPSSGQTCHAYCTFCFRWPQFVGMNELKFATDEAGRFQDYLRNRREITDVLFTGGDPMVMRTEVFARYVKPLLSEEFDHIQTIRIGSKSLSYWPYRFLTDKDSDDMLRLIESVVKRGKHVAFMAHINHGVELATPAFEEAVSRLRSAGAVIRTQAPLLRHINDHAEIWAEMWKEQVRLGCVPYYMFVERQTGAKCFFSVPLARAHQIYRDAVIKLSGLARTARGPVMSALPGKILVDGVAEIAGEKVFVLSLLQARDANWCKRPFFAKYDDQATWINDLKPAFGESEFFYQPELRTFLANKQSSSNGRFSRMHELEMAGETQAI